MLTTITYDINYNNNCYGEAVPKEKGWQEMQQNANKIYIGGMELWVVLLLFSKRFLM